MDRFKNLPKRQKSFVIIGAIILAFALIYSVSTTIYRGGKIKTTIKYAPYAATVTLNDVRVTNNSVAWLSPGSYTVKVSFNEHFEEYTETVDINNENNQLLGILESLDEEGDKYITNHSKEFNETEGSIGILLNQQGDKQKQKYPILNHLPINTSLYSISFTYDDNNAPIITVKADAENIDDAVNKIKSFSDVTIEDLNLKFETTKPFSDYKENSNTNPKEFIKSAYQLDDKYVIVDGKTDNNYYYTYFYVRNYEHDLSYAHYRVILKKAGKEWRTAADPQPLFTTNNTKDLDKDLLKTINSY